MARIRSIKPEYFTHPAILTLSIPARLLFIALWTHADDKGRLYDQSAKIRGLAFGDDDRVNIEALLAEMLTPQWCEKCDRRHGHVERYVAEDRRCLAIVHFGMHQRIDRASPSTIPAPAASAPAKQERSSNDARTRDESSTNHPRTIDEHSTNTRRVLDESSTIVPEIFGNDCNRDREGEGEGEQGAGKREQEAALVARAREDAARFEREFWAPYPKARRIGKATALARWRKLSPADRDRCRDVLAAWIASPRWAENGGEFVPHAERFLPKYLDAEPAPAAATTGNGTGNGTHSPPPDGTLSRDGRLIYGRGQWLERDRRPEPPSLDDLRALERR